VLASSYCKLPFNPRNEGSNALDDVVSTIHQSLPSSLLMNGIHIDSRHV